MRAVAAVALAALVAGCGPSCLDEAEAAAQEKVDRECPGSFASCPTRARILAELQTAQEACPLE